MHFPCQYDIHIYAIRGRYRLITPYTSLNTSKLFSVPKMKKVYTSATTEINNVDCIEVVKKTLQKTEAGKWTAGRSSC